MTDTTTSNWQNWSKSLPPSKAQVHSPEDLEALSSLVKSHSSGIRPVGSGHSWMPLVPSKTAIVKLDHFGGVGEIDGETQQAWLGAGGRLHDLSPELADKGYAFRNLGDIDVQTLAGATSTGTHGTGETLQALAAEIQGLRLVTGTGEHIEISADQNADWLDGGRVALGALGILTEIKMQLVERFKLHRQVWPESHKHTLENAERYWRENRNFEFFYIPFSDTNLLITHNVTEEPNTPRNGDNSTSAVMQLKSLRDALKWCSPLRRWLLKRAISKEPTENVIGESWDMLASERNVLFNEMEYHLPVDKGLEALEEVRHYIEKKRADVFFPFEARKTAGDTAWLSPFNGGSRISIAVHCYHKDAFDFLFTDVEPIFQKYGGRPHWGKLNSMTAAQAREWYPDFDKFAALRRELDPDGRLLNGYLSDLFKQDLS
jgi:FAD-linked oxidoreductase